MICKKNDGVVEFAKFGEILDEIRTNKEAQFVYPNDSCASMITSFYKEFLGEFESKFIDDRSQNSKLSDLAEEIKATNAPLFICGGDISWKLLENAQKAGISKIVDGREFMGYCLGVALNNALKDGAVLSANVAATARESSGVGGEISFEILENGKILYIKENRLLEHFRYFNYYFARYCSDLAVDFAHNALFEFCKNLGAKIEKAGFSLKCIDYKHLDSIESAKKNKGALFLHIMRLTKTQSLIIAKEANALNIPLIYYADELQTWQKHGAGFALKEQDRVIIAPWVMVDFFGKTAKINWLYEQTRPILRTERFIVKTDSIESSKRICVDCGHGFREGLEFCAYLSYEPYYKNWIIRRYAGFDYCLAVDSRQFAVYKAMEQELGIIKNPLKVGSPSIDTRRANFPKEKYCVDFFYFIPKNTQMHDVAVAVREFLARGAKVCLRPHPNQLNLLKYQGGELYADFADILKNPNFSLDESAAISLDFLSRSLVITDMSSTSYSTPYIAAKPVLLFAPNSKEIDFSQNKFTQSYADSIYHIVENDPKALAKRGLKLAEIINKDPSSTKEKIEAHTKDIIYNLDASEEAILSVFRELYKEAYL